MPRRMMSHKIVLLFLSLLTLSSCLFIKRDDFHGSYGEDFLQIDHHTSEPFTLHGEKARRQYSNTVFHGSIATATLVRGDDTFVMRAPVCNDSSTIIGTWTPRTGPKNTNATLADILKDVLDTVAWAKQNGPADNTKLSIDTALRNLVRTNAQAALDEALDFLNNVLLCPATEATHDELRKLLLSDTGKIYRAGLWRGVGLGLANWMGGYYSDKFSDPETKPVFWTKKNAVLGAVGVATSFAIAIVEHDQQDDIFARIPVTVVSAIITGLRKGIDILIAIWNGLNDKKCFTQDAVRRSVVEVANAYDIEAGLDNTRPGTIVNAVDEGTMGWVNECVL